MKMLRISFAPQSRNIQQKLVSAFLPLGLIFFALFPLGYFLVIGEAQESKIENNFAAAGVLVVPTPPAALVSSRCSAYAAPAIPAPLNTYYINANSGSDANDGRTPATAWKTLSKANFSARAGDLFLLRGVFVNQWISPQSSGTAANKIVFRKEPGQNAALEATAGAEIYGVFLGGSHIVIDGLEFRSVPYSVQVVGGSYNWLRNLTIYDSGQITFRFGAHHNRLEDSVIVNIGTDQSNSGDAVSLLGDADDNTVVRNYFGNAGHAGYDDTVQGDSVGFNERNIVAQNIFDNQWASNVIIGGRSGSALGGTLLECNIMRNASRATQYNYARGGLYVNGDYTIVRYNYIYNNKAAGIQVQGYLFAGQEQFPENNQFYHNTVVGNGSAGLYIAAGSTAYVRNNTFENNVFWNNFGSDGANGSRYEIAADFYQASYPWANGFTDNNVFRSNIVSANSKFLIIVRNPNAGGNIYYNSPATAQSALYSWTDNTVSDPLFTYVGGNDYSLLSGSPAINTGRMIPGVQYNESAPDKGAFETGGTAAPTPTATPTVTPTATPTATPTPAFTPNPTPSPVASPSPAGNQSPFNGTAPIAPTIIEAENFDNGGQGVAYYDLDPTNNGGAYRVGEAVDLRRNSAARNGHVVFNASAGEWMEYSFKTYAPGTYDLGVLYASEFSGGKIHLEIDGADVTGALSVNSTGSWWTYKLMGKSGIYLTAGAHILRLAVDSNAAGYQVVADFDSLYVRKRTALLDFDGDGKTDTGVFRPSQGAWYFKSSQISFTAQQFGISTDKLAPADFDGDGKTDIAVFRPSTGSWYRINSSNGQFVTAVFGSAGDIPVPGDYDADGKADITVFRPSSGIWCINRSSDNSTAIQQFGVNGDVPLTGDFDGDGKADITVFRPSDGNWYTLRSSTSQMSVTHFGMKGDIPVGGDFDGDGTTDITVFRPSNGTWYRIESSTSQFIGIQFGLSTDIPSVGDFDGDGKSDVSVFRPSSGLWFRLNSQNNSFTADQFGTQGDNPIPAWFLP